MNSGRFQNTRLICRNLFLYSNNEWSEKENKKIIPFKTSSVSAVIQSRCSVRSYSLQHHGLQYTRLLCPSSTPGACSNSCPWSWWCDQTIAYSVVSFSSCLQCFPASGSFPMSLFFTSGGQSIGVSASVSVFPVNIENWFPLRWAGLISLQSKGLSRVFSNTTVQKH